MRFRAINRHATGTIAKPGLRLGCHPVRPRADFLDLSAELRERCKWSKHLISVTVPVKLDSGEVKVFLAHRVRHHLTQDPVKGGLRYHPAVDLGEVAALAMWMNWKCALMDLTYGGGKGGIACDPRSMSSG